MSSATETPKLGWMAMSPNTPYFSPILEEMARVFGQDERPGARGARPRPEQDRLRQYQRAVTSQPGAA